MSSPNRILKMVRKAALMFTFNPPKSSIMSGLETTDLSKTTNSETTLYPGNGSKTATSSVLLTKDHSFEDSMTDEVLAMSNPVLRQKRTLLDVDGLLACNTVYDEMKLPLNVIPGPRSYPIVGTLWQHLPGGPLYGMSFDEKMSRLQHKYGDIVHEEICPGVHFVHLYNPQHFRIMYEHEGKCPIRDSFQMLKQYNDKYNQGVHGLITSSGETWSRLRKLIQKKVSKPECVRSYTPAHNKIADDFVQLIRHIRNNKNVIHDLTPELYRFSTESVGVICFNKRLGILDTAQFNSQADKFISAVKDVFIASQTENKSLPFYKICDTPTFRTLKRAQQYIYSLSESFIQEAINKNQDQSDIISYLKTDKSLSHRETVTLLAEFFFGGVDTTSHLIAFALYHLSRNTSKVAVLMQEIEKVIADCGEVTPKHLDKTNYLKAVIKETLRLTPISPGNLRTLTSEAKIGDYQLPAGTRVILHNEWAGKQERFVPQASQFIPERWLRNEKYSPINPFTVLGFGFGPRSCPGRRIAEQEVAICIIKLLQNFKIEYCSNEEMKYDMQIINTPTTPVSFKFTDLAS